MNNILIELRDNLQKCTAQNLTAADLADVLGYGGTQIKAYLRDINSGTLTKSNARLERAAFFANELGAVKGFDTLLPLMKKFDPDENGDGAWMDRARRKVGAAIENQIDIDDVLKPETADKKSVFLGHESILTLDMIKSDVESGHIQEGYDALVSKLVDMFGEKSDYHFSEVRGALVALDCPEMVAENEQSNEAAFFSLLCKSDVICEETSEESRKEIAERMFLVKPDLHVSMFGEYIKLIESHDCVSKLTNRRVLKRYFEDCKKRKFLFPDYVPLEVRQALANYDEQELKEAFATGGETCTMRILKGFMKK